MKKLFSLILMMLGFSLFSCTSDDVLSDNENIDPETETTPEPEEPSGLYVVYGPDHIEKLKAIIAEADPNSVAYNAYLSLIKDSSATSTWENYVGLIPTYIARDAASAGDLDEEGNPFAFSFSNNSTLVTRQFDAAYMSALLFALGVENAETHAEKSVWILYEYAKNVTMVCNTGNAPLMCGQAYHAASALALLKQYGYEGLTDEKYDAIVNDLLIGCFVPVLDYFFSAPPYTNGNWGLCATLSYMAIAVVADNQEMYDFAIKQYTSGNDNGTIYNYIDEVTGQCQETGRDQGHVQFGFSCAALICEIAYNQGDTDLYLENSTALLTGFEYTAKLLLGEDVPYYVWTDITGKYCNWGSIGTSDPDDGPSYSKCWSVVYNHFVNRLGMSMPYTLRLFEENNWPSTYSSEGYWYDVFTFTPHPDDNN